MLKENNEKNPYEEIIDMQHHISSEHSHMSIYDRAAQFSPFAALTGYDGAVKETARLTNERIELDETEKNILDEKLRILQENLVMNNVKSAGSNNNSIVQNEIEFEFFKPDEHKEGGAYISVRGNVRKIDKYEKIVIMQDGIRIPIEEIIDMTGEIFSTVDDYN